MKKEGSREEKRGKGMTRAAPQSKSTSRLCLEAFTSFLQAGGNLRGVLRAGLAGYSSFFSCALLKSWSSVIGQ